MGKIGELLGSVQSETVSKDDEETDLAILEGRKKAVEIKGLSDKFDLRKKWSNWIIGWISALLLFNASLTIWVGTGNSAFDDLEWFITSVIVQIAIQIIGLGYVAAKFLFSDGSE